MARYWQRRIVIVCGYGCHLDTKEGPTPLKPYLIRVARFFNQLPEGVFGVFIFCGGFTQNKTAPGTTEAQVMQEFVMKLRATNRGPKVFQTYQESRAFTTFDNISMAVDSIRASDKLASTRGQWFDTTKITIFCEATQSANVMMLSRHFLLPFVNSIDDITIETDSWERDDPFKQVWNLIYNKLAIKFPWLGLAELERRRRIRRSWEI
jgi:hypothetical protein